MAANINEELQWFTVFRTDDAKADWLFQELTAGRLRQGWGAPGCALLTADRQRIEKPVFVERYRTAFGEAPKRKTFAILTRMLDLNDQDVVIVPNMPVWRKQFTIARVRQGYDFDTESDLDDHRHMWYLRDS